MAKNNSAKTRVVEAAMTSSTGGGWGALRLTGKDFEDAQGAAVEAAMKKGIIDPDELREIKAKARADLKEQHRKNVAKFVKEQNASAKSGVK